MFTKSDVFRLIIEYLPDQIYLKDVYGHFLLCNFPVALNAGCVAAEEVIGKTDFDFYPAETAERFRLNEQHILSTGIALVNHEEHFTNKETKEKKWNLTTKVPIRNQQGLIVGLLGINRDITLSKRALLAREETMADLEQRNIELENFTNILSHSLRVPVANLLGLAELVSDLDPDTPSDNRILFKNIADSARKLDTIIHELNEILEERRRS